MRKTAKEAATRLITTALNEAQQTLDGEHELDKLTVRAELTDCDINRVVFSPVNPAEAAILCAPKDRPFFALSQDDNGFFYGEWINAVRLAKIQADAQEADEEALS